MKILALDTSTRFASVAAWDERVLASASEKVTTHSERLMAMIDEVLREAGWQPRELDAIACGAGPGSFTGLRIGLATAKGLCFALGRPLALVSSLEALAARAPDGRVCAVIDAYKREVYAGRFAVERGVPRAEGPEEVLPPERLRDRLVAPVVLLGDGAVRYRSLWPELPLVDETGGPLAGDVARLGARRANEDLRAAPAYLRPSEPERLKEERERSMLSVISESEGEA
jgi:tRNA threonylcarbamoyladenosine biosynthesis protein TsaB